MNKDGGEEKTKRRKFIVALAGTAMVRWSAQKAFKTHPYVRFVSWGGIGGLKHVKVKGAKKIGVDTHRLPINPWLGEKIGMIFVPLKFACPPLKKWTSQPLCTSSVTVFRSGSGRSILKRCLATSEKFVNDHGLKPLAWVLCGVNRLIGGA